jgi:hypothetical protein
VARLGFGRRASARIRHARSNTCLYQRGAWYNAIAPHPGRNRPARLAFIHSPGDAFVDTAFARRRDAYVSGALVAFRVAVRPTQVVVQAAE